MKWFVAVLSLLFVSVSFAAKTYQVTGPVLDVTDSKITIQKGNDKWEIDRGPNTKVDGDLKVGQKVTIEYTMSAEKVEVKKK
jgi:hypothetical protein